MFACRSSPPADEDIALTRKYEYSKTGSLHLVVHTAHALRKQSPSQTLLVSDSFQAQRLARSLDIKTLSMRDLERICCKDLKLGQGGASPQKDVKAIWEAALEQAKRPIE